MYYLWHWGSPCDGGSSLAGPDPHGREGVWVWPRETTGEVGAQY